MAAPSSTESRSNYLTQQIIQPETTDDPAHQKLIHSTGDEENNNTFYIQERFLRETTRYFSGLEKPLKCGQKVNTLEELIEGLHREFSTNYVNVKMVNHLMLSYQSNAKEWQKFAKFDRYKYTRNLVDAGNGRFNLMILCWGEGHGSTIHDHSDAHCFMKILKGELREIRYDMPEAASADIDSQLTANNFNEPKTDSLTETRQTIFGLNDVAYINDHLGLHRVENPSHSETAVSLHLYCPPFDSCSIFEKNSGKRVQCKMTFWSKYGQRIPQQDK